MPQLSFYVVIVAFCFSSHNFAIASESFSLHGSSSLKIQKPKAETKVVLSARYVLDASQELVTACPSGFKAISVACDAEARAMGSVIDNDLTFQNNLTSGSVKEETGTCRAGLIRPSEVVKLSMDLKCTEREPQVSASR